MTHLAYARNRNTTNRNSEAANLVAMVESLRIPITEYEELTVALTAIITRLLSEEQAQADTQEGTTCAAEIKSNQEEQK